MSERGKRRAAVPHLAQSLGELVSKADLLEACWGFAELCADDSPDDGPPEHDPDSADLTTAGDLDRDDYYMLARLVHELQLWRTNQGRPALHARTRTSPTLARLIRHYAKRWRA